MPTRPRIRNLYANATENEIEEAERLLEEYLLLVLRIFERTESENKQDSKS